MNLEDKELKHFQVMDKTLLDCVSMESLREFDINIAEIFKKKFYSYSHDINEENSLDAENGNGLVNLLLRNWKHAIGISSFSKILPTILSGSLVEGASLSRLFRPSTEENLELEADVMYIMGVINDDVGSENSSVHDVPGKFGFVTLSPSEAITMFTEEIKVSDIVETAKNGLPRINGSKLRSLHQQLQPCNTVIDFSIPPSLVSVEQKISGPSAEVRFGVHRLAAAELDGLIEFFTEVANLISSGHTRLVESLDQLNELQTILRSVMDCLNLEEKYRINKVKRELTYEEIQDMFEQVSTMVDQYMADAEIFKCRVNDFQNLMRRARLFCGDRKDEFLLSNMDEKIINPLLEESAHSKIGKSAIETKCNQLGMAIYVDIAVKLFEQELSDFEILFVTNQCQRMIKTLQVLKESNVTSADYIISFDNVSCFYYPHWPDIANEWSARERQWPPKEIIKEVIDKGCYIVPKQSSPEEDDRFEWRYSFSLAEIKLALNRSPKMSYCYFIFKSLFYRHFKTMPSPLPSHVSLVRKK